jgi:serine/threonine protein phosphatase PrpC
MNPQRENILLRGGVVGYQLPPLRASVFTISKGDTLIFATDGIQNGFIDGANKNANPQQIADSICERYKKETDDALVLVVRYRGILA